MTAKSAIDNPQRMSALALWRYAHDYLRCAKMLVGRHRLCDDETQVPYHVVAQSIEFALKAFLRAQGVGPEDLKDDFGHSIDRAMERALSLGLPPLPRAAHAAVDRLAPHHRDREFRHLQLTYGFPDLRPMFTAAVHILDAIAEDVAADYLQAFGGDGSPTVDEFVQRLRADLAATAANGG